VFRSRITTATPEAAACTGDAAAKKVTWEQLIAQDPAVAAALNEAYTACAPG
jgi:hypothetical protein